MCPTLLYLQRAGAPQSVASWPCTTPSGFCTTTPSGKIVPDIDRADRHFAHAAAVIIHAVAAAGVGIAHAGAAGERFPGAAHCMLWRCRKDHIQRLRSARDSDSRKGEVDARKSCGNQTYWSHGVRPDPSATPLDCRPSPFRGHTQRCPARAALCDRCTG